METEIPNSIKFFFGGLSGMGATLVVQPLDLIKNRMQISCVNKERSKEYQSSLRLLLSIIKNEGIFAIYNGLSAGLARQATYTTTRLGTYTYFYEKFSRGEKNPSFIVKASLGMFSGAIGSFVGNPTEVALIRMTSDGQLLFKNRRNYKSVFNAIVRISKEEGIFALWKGATPTIMRAMIVNAAQLATYSQAKQAILATNTIKDGTFCHFVASMISGLATTIASMPVDIVKTRLQNMQLIDGKPEYKNIADVIRKIISQEGFLALWKGFIPYYLRLGPHTVLTFIILEKITELYYKKILNVERKPKTF